MADRLRVLFCTLDYPPGATGGAEQQAKLQAEELVRRGHTVEVVCPRSAGQGSQTINGVRVRRLLRIDRRPFRTISYLLVLACYLLVRLPRFQIVHVHLANAQADVAVAVGMVLRKASYLKIAAGGPLGEIARFRHVATVTRYFGIRRASLVQAISAEIVEDLIRTGVRPNRIRAIPNGVSARSPVTPSGRRIARRSLELDETITIVLYAGRLEVDKGVADLLRAWSEPIGNAQLIIIGSPGIKGPVTMQDLPQGVDYRGWSMHVQDYLAAADVFVLPSHAEGMSNALLEAMVAGIPAIATMVGAAEEMISDGETGILTRPGDIGALRAAIQRLVSDHTLRSRIGMAAHRSARQRYGIERVVDSIEDAYRSILVRR